MRRILILSVLLLLPIVGAAQTPVTLETVTFTNSATAFTATTLRPNGANTSPFVTECQGKVETAPIRVRFDGTAPTASVGYLLDVGDSLTIRGLAYLNVFQGIRTGATSGVINFICNGLSSPGPSIQVVVAGGRYDGTAGADKVVLVNAAGTVIVPSPYQTGTWNATTATADSASSVAVLAANAARLSFRCMNTSSVGAWAAVGRTATATNNDRWIAPGDEWVRTALVPTGAINAIWVSDPGDGQMLCSDQEE